ncbi:MAG: hypothetical protein H6870_18765 [Methylobacteriaceae bacterium]|nr:hypothetical protein [Methylobacteriaceae bacterium]
MSQVDASEFKAEHAALATRVGGIEKSVTELATATRDQFASMRQDTALQTSSLTNAISNLQSTINQNTKPQWVVLIALGSLIVTVLGLIGTLAYRPVDQAITRVEKQVEMIDREQVPRVEHVERWRQYERYQDQIYKRLDRLDEEMRRRQ